MYIYGYCRSSLFDRKKYKKIEFFCNENKMNISEIFNDYGLPRYDYFALKKLISRKDILIIADVNDLGKNKAQILDELTYLVKNEIRIVVLNHPETLFAFPNNNADEIEKYYANIVSSNINLLQNYAASTKQSINIDNLGNKRCRIIINGKELNKDNLIKLRPCEFIHPGTKNKIFIKSARILTQLKS